MKKQISKFIKDKTPYVFIIKIVILIVLSYLLIQLSNKVKNIEETQYIPGMQNSLNYAEHYITWRYRGAWEELGHRMKIDELYSLEIEMDNRTLGVIRGGYSEFLLHLGFHRAWGEKGSGYRIWIQYGSKKLVEITFFEGEDHVSYYILYKDGHYIPNLEMEQYSGITTDEILEQAEEMCASFETELQKMHEYQLEKVRKRRRNLTNVGFILLAFYMFIKWRTALAEFTDGDKPMEQCLGETIVNTINKFSRRKYALSGAAILFPIYMLRPIISSFILFGVERPVNICISYGISSIIVAVVGYFILAGNGEVKAENKVGVAAVWQTLQMAAGCILGMFIIRLGMMIVSDFYSRSLQFYIINGTAWFGATLLIFLSRRIMKIENREKRKNKKFNN